MLKETHISNRDYYAPRYGSRRRLELEGERDNELYSIARSLAEPATRDHAITCRQSLSHPHLLRPIPRLDSLSISLGIMTMGIGAEVVVTIMN